MHCTDEHDKHNNVWNSTIINDDGDGELWEWNNGDAGHCNVTVKSLLYYYYFGKNNLDLWLFEIRRMYVDKR